MLLLSDLVVIIFSSYVVFTPNGQFVNVPLLHSVMICESFHAHFSALFYSAHSVVLVPALQKMQNETIIKMRSVTTRKLQMSATVKKEGLISSKIEQYEVILT